MLAYPQEQRTDLRREGHRCGDSEAEGEDLKDCGADASHEDDGEKLVAEFGAGGEIDCPVSAVHRQKHISVCRLGGSKRG